MNGTDAPEPGGSKQTSTKPRRALQSERGRRSKPKDSSNDLNEDEKKELLRKYAETDENLEKFAQAHNMTALNVKSVLRSVIKNHRALARVLGTEAPDDSIDGVRITRSKTKALQHSSSKGVDMTSNVPIKRGHLWVNLRFNEDDEYDNDYRPGEDDSGDEVGTDSSLLGSSEDEESDHLSELDDEESEKSDDEQNQTLVDKFSEESKKRIVRKSCEVASRPRPESAASLTLNAMIAEDDEPSIDYNAFVNNINLIPYDENEEDPDFMVPTDALFTDDRDDCMDDFWSSTIPQKEMEDLIEDIVPSEKIGELAKNLSPPLRQMETANEGTMVEAVISPNRVRVEKEREEVVREKIFTDHHRRRLSTQMEQHVQLLTQSYVGCYFEPLLQEEKKKTREMLDQLSEISSSTWHLGEKSAFHIGNLSTAIDTCNGMSEKTFEKPIRPLSKEELTINYSLLSITKEVLSSSQAIRFPHLVSKHRLVQSVGNNSWNQNEVLLYAMAHNRYYEQPEKHRLPRQNRYSIIAENCMPWRTMNELRWVYNGMRRGLVRNGRTAHNTLFFDVAEGKKKMTFPLPRRAKEGWTMRDWPKDARPDWLSFNEKRSIEVMEKKNGKSKMVEKRMRKERRIEEGDEENEPIVILEEEEGEGEGIEGEVEEEEEGRNENMEMDTVNDGEEENMDDGDGEREETRNIAKEMMIYSVEDDECAMDSIGKSEMDRSPEEVEAVRGEESREGQGEGGGGGLPIDFSHLMNEMSPRPGPSRLRSPSPIKARSPSPNEKSIFPLTPGKRIPSPSEDSMPWLLDMPSLRYGFESPQSQSPSANSRIKTPGGTTDYVDSLMGYFGTPEKEMEEGTQKQSSSKRPNAYSNLFGDFDFDESDEDEEMTSVAHEEKSCERKKESESRVESGTATVEGPPEDKVAIVPEEVPVKQRKKRRTREEKEKMGLAAIKDMSLRRRVMCALAKKTNEDIRARMRMHSSVFRHIQKILSDSVDRGERDKMFEKLEPVLSERHREVVYLLAVFVPPSSLPRSLVLSQGRQTYVAAMNMLCIIYAYMSKIQRRMSYRQLLRIIVDAHSKGGSSNVMATLKGVLVNEPLLLAALSRYHTPPVPSKKSKVWECIDLRKGDEAFNIFKENPRTERVDLCEVMGGVPTKKMIAKRGKTPSTLLINHDGEPVLRRKNGKYTEIAVMSEQQMEEERKNRAMEREEEKKAKQRERTKERKEAAKKAKMVERREERAREKKKEMERKQEEEERKKEERQAPPTHPFTRDMDKALLLLYNEVQKVTKRAVRKMAVDIPYSTNFSMEQLQSRLDFLLAIAKED